MNDARAILCQSLALMDNLYCPKGKIVKINLVVIIIVDELEKWLLMRLTQAWSAIGGEQTNIIVHIVLGRMMGFVIGFKK